MNQFPSPVFLKILLCSWEIHQKKLKNVLDRGLLEMGWKFLKIFRKSTWISRKIQDNQHLTNISIGQRNLRNCLQNFACLDQNEEIFQENVEIFWSKSPLGNWLLK